MAGTGLLVRRLDYVRVLHPRDTVVTSTTRAAAYLIDGGRLVTRHPARCGSPSGWTRCCVR
jgi:hypothetical protein